MKDIYDEAFSLKSELTQWRRIIHSNPELGMELPITTAFVCEKLKGFGLAPQKLGGGVVCLIKGDRPGKTIMLRADMDALPMQEMSGLSFASKIAGKNHACGHDMHTAMLLGAAKILSNRTSEIYGTIKLCFQPAEETAEGALSMINAGVMENPTVDVALGQHMVLGSHYPTGSVAACSNVTLASSILFKILIHGKGSHGARPQTSVDPINIAYHIYAFLKDVTNNQISPLEPAVLSIGEISGGSMPNSIPSEAYLRGTARTMNTETHQFVKNRICEIPIKVAEIMGGKAEVKIETEIPPTINDKALTTEMMNYSRELLGDDRVFDLLPRMGAEDFSRFSLLVPSTFIFISGGSIDEGYTVGTHNQNVVFNEDALPYGAANYAYCATQWLAAHAE